MMAHHAERCNTSPTTPTNKSEKLYPFLTLKIENSRALLLYSSDTPPTASPYNNLISIQLDSITLNKIIANSEALGKVVKKINFRDVNGFAKLVKGESSKFSFVEDEGLGVCDASCDVRCKKIPLATPKPTLAPEKLRPEKPRPEKPRPYIAKKDSVTNPPLRGPTYLPPISVTKHDEAITPRRPVVTQPTRAAPLSTTQRPIIQTTTTQRPEKPTTYRPAKPVTTTYRPAIQSSTKLITTPRITTLRPAITQRSTVPARPRLSTKGPAYLPLAKISTARKQSVTERSYPPATWPSTTRLYTQTFPTWSAPIRRSTEAQFTTSTAKYLYEAPSNSLSYAGEAE